MVTATWRTSFVAYDPASARNESTVITGVGPGFWAQIVAMTANAASAANAPRRPVKLRQTSRQMCRAFMAVSAARQARKPQRQMYVDRVI